MRVRCVKLTNSYTGRNEEQSPWLTLGKLYVVLCVDFDRQLGLQFRIVGDDGETPALHAASQFDLVNGQIPPNWVLRLDGNQAFELTPPRWARKGFWEEYFDGVPEAVKAFQDEVDVIIAAN